MKVDLREDRIFLKSKSLARWIAVGRDDGTFTLEDPLRDGWLATSDSAARVDGGLQILGRRDDVVKVLGVLVPLQEVEYGFLSLLDAGKFRACKFCVIAVADPRTENRLILMTDSSASLRELLPLVEKYNASVTGPLRLQNICWVPKIPVNEMGKIRKHELLSLFIQR